MVLAGKHGASNWYLQTSMGLILVLATSPETPKLRPTAPKMSPRTPHIAPKAPTPRLKAPKITPEAPKIIPQAPQMSFQAPNFMLPTVKTIRKHGNEALHMNLLPAAAAECAQHCKSAAAQQTFRRKCAQASEACQTILDTPRLAHPHLNGRIYPP